MNLNKGCIEIENPELLKEDRKWMNLNKGCIEIRKDDKNMRTFFTDEP